MKTFTEYIEEDTARSKSIALMIALHRYHAEKHGDADGEHQKRIIELQQQLAAERDKDK